MSMNNLSLIIFGQWQAGPCRNFCRTLLQSEQKSWWRGKRSLLAQKLFFISGSRQTTLAKNKRLIGRNSVYAALGKHFMEEASTIEGKVKNWWVSLKAKNKADNENVFEKKLDKFVSQNFVFHIPAFAQLWLCMTVSFSFIRMNISHNVTSGSWLI